MSIGAVHCHSLRRLSQRGLFIQQPGPHRARVAARAQELDVQVFRFTLGIPGFDDANIPRVVGIIGGVLLTANHLMSASPVSDAQVLCPDIRCNVFSCKRVLGSD